MTLTGWYSATAAKQHGWCFYEDPEGNKVKVTLVTGGDGNDYVWADKVCVGPIVWGPNAISGKIEDGEKQCVEMEGVREYIEVEPVKLVYNNAGHLVVQAINEGGYNSTEVDLLQLIQWLKTNRPELLQ
jgi:hypothetical protein